MVGGKKRNTEVAETGAQRRVVVVGRDSWGSDGGRVDGGRNFEIWAGTGATMGKGSAEVCWK